jgi:hypothetical protein
MTNRHIARRTLLSGIALGAGFGAGIGSDPAAAREGSEPAVSSQGYWAKRAT